MRCLLIILSIVSLITMNASLSQAGVVGTAGSLSLESPPADVRGGALLSDSLITAFSERQGVVLPQSLTFNLTLPGTAPGPDAIDTSPGDIAAGTRVDSYLVHFQSISGTNANPVLASGSITFDTDVMGIAFFNGRLNQSDPFLGLASTLYPVGEDRELEIEAGGIVGDRGHDSITLSADRRTVTFNLGNTGGPDQARIVVATVPEASSISLAAIGAACLGACGVRRRLSGLIRSRQCHR